MKIYLSIDMEGMPGTYNWDHERIDRSTVKRSMRQHVEKVLQCLLEHPEAKRIEQIVIADSHSAGDNLDHDITLLDERIALISGSPRPLYMMPEIDTSFDRVMLLGYHAGTGALRANMDHTYSNSRIHKISINGQRMNEALINAAYAGHLGVPVCLVSGDAALKSELMQPDAMPWVEFVSTKQAVAKFAAMNFSLLSINKAVENAVNAAMSTPREAIPLFRFTGPMTLKIEFHSTAMTDVACLMPAVIRIDGRNIEYKHNDYAVMFEAIMALVTLASTAGM